MAMMNGGEAVRVGRFVANTNMLSCLSVVDSIRSTSSGVSSRQEANTAPFTERLLVAYGTLSSSRLATIPDAGRDGLWFILAGIPPCGPRSCFPT